MENDRAFHVVVGAGPVGSEAARILAASGERVRLISRRGVSLDDPLIEAVAADAADAVHMRELTAGAQTVFNCAMPRYDRWPEEFPAIAAALLNAASSSGARYLIAGNTYGYGPVKGPLTEDLPMAPTTIKGKIRAQMWTDALDAQRAGRVRATEVRSSDFLGKAAVSIFTLMVSPRILAGEPASALGDLDVPHSWTYTGDVARTLVRAARSETAWGHAWHTPSTTLSLRALSRELADAAGAPSPRLQRMPLEELRRLGAADSIVNELVEMAYLFESPTVLDSTVTERALDVRATPLQQVLAEMTR